MRRRASDGGGCRGKCRGRGEHHGDAGGRRRVDARRRRVVAPDQRCQVDRGAQNEDFHDAECDAGDDGDQGHGHQLPGDETSHLRGREAEHPEHTDGAVAAPRRRDDGHDDRYDAEPSGYRGGGGEQLEDRRDQRMSGIQRRYVPPRADCLTATSALASDAAIPAENTRARHPR